MVTATDINVIWKYFPQTDDTVREKLAMLAPLYRHHNSQVNVISRKDIDHLYLHHVLHALALHFWVPFVPGGLIVDAGTGGGFPGIPLAIFHADCQFFLVDSVAKKSATVAAICKELQMDNVEIINARIEQVDLACHAVIARALASARQITQWCRRLERTSAEGFRGYFLLKGGDQAVETSQLRRPHQVFALGDLYDEPYFREKWMMYIAGHRRIDWLA